MKRVSVLIVDDHPLVADGLASLLSEADWLQLTGRARTLKEAQVFCEHQAPDVILLDLRLPDSQGIATIVAVQRFCPSARIVVVTAYEWGLESEARELGVAAFLNKEAASDSVLHAISALFPTVSPGDSTQLLTPREEEVARLAAEGLSNSEIAEALYISENTVKTHLGHILEKLRVASRVELARRWKQDR